MNGPFVEIGGGHRLHLRDRGEGHTLLLLAGWAMDGRGWGDTMLRLNQKGYRAVACDRRGHGRSTDPDGYDYDTLADARAVDVSMTLIHGDRDRSAPINQTARRYAELVPGARLVVYPGAAHGLMVTHAARPADDIVAACGR